MSADLPRINFPEIFLGFVAPVGVDMHASLKHFRTHFERFGYNVIPIKVTDVFEVLSKHISPAEELVTHPPELRLQRYIKYGNRVREVCRRDSILAALSILRVAQERLKQVGEHRRGKNVYLLYQFKRREEIDLLRSTYGRLFFQVSIYSRTGARVEYLATSFARAANSGTNDQFRPTAQTIIQTDQNEMGDDHGQRVSSIFHNGDLILNADSSDDDLQDQICRFTNLLFGSNKISPTRHEYGMFVAKSAALRTLDLSRQVGAAVFSPEGEVVSMGSNEVPKAGGGTYWCDDPKEFDDRDYVREYDSNDRRKKEILFELLNALGVDPKKAADNRAIEKSQFMDALEYGRIIHAEMSAICDAARLGRALGGTTLYTTTFPCHMCAKHVVAAGIAKVIFLEPYPKSLTASLHGDAVQIEGADRGRHHPYPSVEFAHFHGISHRRYRELFERGRRKDGEGNFLEWSDPFVDKDVDPPKIYPRPIIDLKFPFYLELERNIMETYKGYLEEPPVIGVSTVQGQ